MPTAVLSGRYLKTPKELRFCICGASEVEDLAHYILTCPLYTEPRVKFLANLLNSLNCQSDGDKLISLLSDTNSFVSHRMSLFAIAAKKIRANEVLRRANT